MHASVPTFSSTRHAHTACRVQRPQLRTSIPAHSSHQKVGSECTRGSCEPCRPISKVDLNETWRKVCTVFAVAQMVVLPFPDSSLAALDTSTEKAGVGATIEASDISNEDQRSVLAKLQQKILPDAKDLLTRVGKGEGSNYPSSIAKELETVDLEVNDLIKQANKGGDMSNIKSAASGIEQQVNALKAIVGFD